MQYTLLCHSQHFTTLHNTSQHFTSTPCKCMQVLASACKCMQGVGEIRFISVVSFFGLYQTWHYLALLLWNSLLLPRCNSSIWQQVIRRRLCQMSKWCIYVFNEWFLVYWYEEEVLVHWQHTAKDLRLCWIELWRDWDKHALHIERLLLSLVFA